MKNTKTLVRNYRVQVEGTKKRKAEMCKFIRMAQEAQVKELNRYSSYLVTTYYSSCNNKEALEYVKNLSTDDNVFTKNIRYGNGINTPTLVKERVVSDFNKLVRESGPKSDILFKPYSKATPLITRPQDLHIKEVGDDIVIEWVNGIAFKVWKPSSDKDKKSIKDTFKNIIKGNYSLLKASFFFNNQKKLFISFEMEVPVKETTYVKGRTLGIDIGVKYPAYLSISDMPYQTCHIGQADELIRVREQMKKRKERVYEQTKSITGNKGNKRRLKALNSLKEKEKNFVNTYNHQISKRVVDFAIKNQCEYINMESLKKDSFKDKILTTWSCYDLQTLIKYKAELNGIKVRFVKANYTSQRCSRCGHIDKKNRVSQELFICKKCGNKMNADQNASLNIARSWKVVDRY